MSKGINCPTQIARPTSGTKITVAQLTVSFVYLRSRPIMMGSARYKRDDVAIPPPVILAGVVAAAAASSSGVPTAVATEPSSSVSSPRNDVAVTSVNATMMYTSASQTKLRKRMYERVLM